MVAENLGQIVVVIKLYNLLRCLVHTKAVARADVYILKILTIKYIFYVVKIEINDEIVTTLRKNV